MIGISEEDFDAGNVMGKQESSIRTSKSSASSGSSTSWTRLKDPRIVRVSRALGGKDRHSKVCTVRGLRDRRVRLSVQTAIQLYDLQDRLGLNQPSKVVEWLLIAAKHDIDELPPLQIPQGCFSQNMDHHQALALVSASTSEEEKRPFAHVENEPLTASFNPFMRWDPPPQPPHKFNLMQWQPPPPSGSHSVFVYHQHGISAAAAAAAQTYLPSEMPGLNIESPTCPSSKHVRSFHFSMTASLLQSNQQNKHNEFLL